MTDSTPVPGGDLAPLYNGSPVAGPLGNGMLAAASDPGIQGSVGDSHVTVFDHDQYNHLVSTVQAVNDAMNKDFLSAGPAIHLDDSLANNVKVGNKSWSAITDLNSALGKFGSSVSQCNDQFGKNWRGLTDSLQKAADVFEKTNDLAKYQADSFQADYPGLAGSVAGGGAPSGGGPAGSSTT